MIDNEERPRPGANRNEAKVSMATATSTQSTASSCHSVDADLTLFDEHGAIIADTAAQAWKVNTWQSAILAEPGEFSADNLQQKHNLPELGNATGGVFLRLSRAGAIKRVGYRTSAKTSRAGGVVAVWRCTEAATS